MSTSNRRSFLSGAMTGVGAGLAQAAQTGGKPRNIVFILTDDHRYDAMGFLKGQQWLETPHLDSIARDGVNFENAIVTTSLCSPSRASVLTGVYAHRHKIVDNNTPIPKGTRFFSQDLQQAGYRTGFIGKWHMGAESDRPQPGFDRWVSFLSQGSYTPTPAGLNVDGKKVPQKGYITDELTDYAVDFLRGVKRDQPYFLYLSHKAVHSEFVPAPRHAGRYKDKEFVYPKSMAKPEPSQHRPAWVQNQRNSWHGVEYPYHSGLNIADYYRRYAETLCAVDESVGRVLDTLRERGELDSTLVVYMGDNGFAFGEHGLIDKRTAYEESIRVPLLARCPELFKAGTAVKQPVANIDLMPTFLSAAGVRVPTGLDGMSWLDLARGRSTTWRDSMLYEYYWERNFPQTPTIHALREQRYKFIRYYGLWDIDELYDLQNDPAEMNNLIFSAEHQEIADRMRKQLFATLERTGGMQIPLFPDTPFVMNHRSPTESRAADFSDELYKTPRRPGNAGRARPGRKKQ
ncbi:MAG: sulfatase [Bryobacteraceae bacterium]